jgi:hypothetical protein
LSEVLGEAGSDLVSCLGFRRWQVGKQQDRNWGQSPSFYISRETVIVAEVVLVLPSGFAQRLASAILWCC